MTPRLLTSALMLLAATRTAPAAEPVRPNVLLILVDDLKPATGSYGDRFARTPNLDRLASRGLQFDLAYCNQAVCAPSRLNLLIGSRSTSTGLYALGNNLRDFIPGAVTLPQHFRNQGYTTVGLGKLFHNESGAKPPFPFSDPPSWSEPPRFADGPHWADWVWPADAAAPRAKGAAVQCLDVPDEAYLDGRIAAAAVTRLRELAARPEPFFLGVGFWKPHLPFNAPRRYWDLYDRARVAPPAPAAAPHGAPALAGHPGTELRGYAGIPKEGPLSPELVAELRHGYLACVSFLDAQVGRVLSELERLGLAERTIVVFWSDHGFHLGEHALWGKTSNYELDTRVPLLIAAPGIARAGGAAAGLAELLDLYPTLAELCGLPAPVGAEGRSLVAQLRDPTAPGARFAASQHPRPSYGKATEMGRALRDDRHRYVEWRELDAGALVARELYDHAVDPAETRNLADDPALAPVVAAFAAELARRTSSTP